MKKIIKLTESDLTILVKRVMSEQTGVKKFIQLNSDLLNMISGNGTAANNVQKVLNRCKTNKNSKTTYTNNIADLLSKSVTGIGTDESGVYNALKKVRTSDELCGVSQSYEERNGESLWRALDGDFDSQTEWSFISKIISNLLTNEKKTFRTGGPTMTQGVKPTRKLTESDLTRLVKRVMSEQYNDEGQLDLNELAKKIVLSKKYSEIFDELTPSDYGDEFEFADNFLYQLLDDYEDEDFYDDLYDVVKMEYGDTILNIYLSDDGVGYFDDEDEDEDM